MLGTLGVTVWYRNHKRIPEENGNGNDNDDGDERRPVNQEFALKQKVLIDDEYPAEVVGQFCDPDRVKVRYTSGKPSWFFNKYIFYCNDYSIKPLNGNENARSSLSESGVIMSNTKSNSGYKVHICNKGAWIENNYGLEQIVAK